MILYVRINTTNLRNWGVIKYDCNHTKRTFIKILLKIKPFDFDNVLLTNLKKNIMKKLILITVLALSTLTFAQEKKGVKDRLSPEQQTELQVKKMTLDLDLNTKQQNELKTILLENVKKREAKIADFTVRKAKGQKLTAEEKFEMKNKMLDSQIEMKATMKKTLTVDQFNKWEANKEKNKKKISQKHNKRKGNQEVTK